jgi:hypothetical protein
MGVGGQRHAPTALPSRETRYPLYSRLGGLQDWFGPVRKILPTPSRDSNPLTVLPVANRYTDYAIAAHNSHHAHVTLLPYSEVQVQPIRNARRALWSTETSLKCADIHYSENNSSPPSTSAVYSPQEQAANELRPQLPCLVAPTSMRFVIISLNSLQK